MQSVVQDHRFLAHAGLLLHKEQHSAVCSAKVQQLVLRCSIVKTEFCGLLSQMYHMHAQLLPVMLQEAYHLQLMLAHALVHLQLIWESCSALGQGRAQQPQGCPMQWPAVWDWSHLRRPALALWVSFKECRKAKWSNFLLQGLSGLGVCNYGTDTHKLTAD